MEKLGCRHCLFPNTPRIARPFSCILRKVHRYAGPITIARVVELLEMGIVVARLVADPLFCQPAG
jgi:hypothetical protein